MKKPLFPENIAYTFSDFFKSNAYLDEITEYFGYSFEIKNYPLPRSTAELTELPILLRHWEESLPYISLNNEMAKREFLIAPLLLEVVRHTHAKLKSEFILEISDKLKGSLDYLLQGKNNFLVIEAKNGDLDQATKQLAVQLIALHQWLENDKTILYGAVSIGKIWQFCILDTVNKKITQDSYLFRVPTDVEDLLRTIIAILES
ncbi:MAG: hypothetical protein RL368_90 [Pseudomonadota bacterium]|jgi:hypothetical protein